jgi:phospholipase/lecithinase/hemolysin
MKSTRLNFAAFVAALILSACGGGDSAPALNSMVSFGDSLSDVGTYKVGTIAAVGGGEWTVNSPTARNWTELVAAEARTAAPCPAQTGLLVNIPGFEGAAVTNHAECTNYAQGSARVSNSYSLNAAALQAAPFNQVNLGLMAMPLTTQMATYLANVGGSYSGSEVVTVMTGGNDLFMHLIGVASAAAGGPEAVAAAFAAGWPPEVQSTVAGGGAAAATAAASAGVNGMAQAGAELATLVKTQVLAKGARYVAVLNLPDVSQSPFGMGVDAQTRGLVAGMVTAFNGQLQAGLTGTPVLLLDAFALSQDHKANPAKYGITDTSTPACSTTSPANPLQGSSLACTAASTVAPDTSGYLYADNVHPSPLGHRLYAQFVIDRMRSAGWL